MLRLIDPAMEMFLWQRPQQGEPWKILSHCTTFQSAVEQIAEIYEFQWHPYFIWARSAKVDCIEFVRSQMPFQCTIQSFSQALQIVFDRADPRIASSEFLPTYPLVDTQSSPYSQSSSHTQSSPRRLFQHCLRSLAATIELSSICPPTIASANQGILDHCLTQPVESSAATLGIIEYLYVDISATLAQIVQQRGWADANNDFYYTIHDALGVPASRDLLLLASAAWKNPQTQPQIAQSLILGAQYLWALYDGLYPDQPLDD